MSRKCSVVKYREFSTHGSGRTTNNAGNISPPFDVRRNTVVRLSISYRPCGEPTKFNTKDNEITSYLYRQPNPPQQRQYFRSSGNFQRHKILFLNPWIPTFQINPPHPPTFPLHNLPNRIINLQTPHFQHSESLCGGRFEPLDKDFGGVAAALSVLALGRGLLVYGEGD
jgi:hypothetical protein